MLKIILLRTVVVILGRRRCLESCATHLSALFGGFTLGVLGKFPGCEEGLRIFHPVRRLLLELPR